MATIGVNKSGDIIHYVEGGEIQHHNGINYIDVENELIEPMVSHKYKILNFKYKYGKIYMPFYRTIRSKIKVFFKRIDVKRISEQIIDMLPYFLASSISAFLASIITIFSLALQDNIVVSQNDFITIFIPCLAALLTLFGVYASIREARLASEQQRENSVKPILTFSGFKKNQHPLATGVIELNIEGLGENNDSQARMEELFFIENIGLGKARNIQFVNVDRRGVFHHHGHNIKLFEPGARSEMLLTVPNTLDPFSSEMIILYSRCENIYGDTVIHKHIFALSLNANNIDILRDESVMKKNKENRDIIRRLQ
ncbi:hypothetical protein [Desulfotalea psychrophila]|uniref:Uncharacterized protein n=1 Tax=Desulfotalea psychrophila (strain LSv54 / DSM 12343) TaxID=177439 RepID=Q6AQX4_DESPS|nr:hypothetical protein [Desulfotalea psychrophila]CAG35250.1 unknown protein [Desulfotalea psychrophila LSv54]